LGLLESHQMADYASLIVLRQKMCGGRICARAQQLQLRSRPELFLTQYD
jgi:hypothetical protein